MAVLQYRCVFSKKLLIKLRVNYTFYNIRKLRIWFKLLERVSLMQYDTNVDRIGSTGPHLTPHVTPSTHSGSLPLKFPGAPLDPASSASILVTNYL